MSEANSNEVSRIIVSGRHAHSVFKPARFIATLNQSILRIDDENNPDFWLEVTLPLTNKRLYKLFDWASESMRINQFSSCMIHVERRPSSCNLQLELDKGGVCSTLLGVDLDEAQWMVCELARFLTHANKKVTINPENVYPEKFSANGVSP